MKIFFEDTLYLTGGLRENLRSDFFFSNPDGSAATPYVGYFYSKALEDIVFILPKIFIVKVRTEEGLTKTLAFREYPHEALIEESSRKELEYSEDLESFLFELSVWIYRAINQYKSRTGTETVKEERIQNVLSNKDDSSTTLLDTVISLINFHKEHNALFTYISRINTSGNNKIHWAKTISKECPVIQNQEPVYARFRNKNKSVSFDEELTVLFYSVLNYLKEKYHFKLKTAVNYSLMSPEQIESLIESGKGTRRLKAIRHKYFSDELIRLWNLLFLFFEKEERVLSGRYHDEYIVVKNFELMFEDMVDSLIGDDSLSDSRLKIQKDGKKVDHIFADKSIFGEQHEIYFIGDSKYYKDIHTVSQESIYKQYTYIRNVMQFNMDIMNRRPGYEDCDMGRLRYYDPMTGGYNITPNFLISPYIDFSNISYTEDSLKNANGNHSSYHHKDQLFDRDTLHLESYTINFLYVLTSYADTFTDESFRRRARKLFRETFVDYIKEKYLLYKVTPTIDMEKWVDNHLRDLTGKIYRDSDSAKYLWLAVERPLPNQAPSINLEELRKEGLAKIEQVSII